jgi:hypothetical protein
MDDASANLGISGEAIVLGPVKDPLAVRGLRSFARVAVAAVLVLASLYVVLAVTVVAVMGSGDENAIVVRAAFPGGIAAQGDFAYISDTAYDRSFTGKVGQAFVGVAGGGTIQIIALPGAVLAVENGQIMADKKATGFVLDGTTPQAKLGHEYLAVCVSGTKCAAGALVVVPDDRVIGKVNKFIGFNGLTDPTTYRS